MWQAVAWAALAGGAAVGMELAFRRGASWLENFWWIAPGSMLINFALYQLLRTDGGWLYSIALFGVVTASMRIIIAFGFTHEPITAGTLIAGGCLLLAALTRLVWR